MIFRILCLAVGACTTACAGPHDAPFEPDEHTSLLVHFDRGADADHALDRSFAQGGGESVKGRFGGALRMARRDSVTFVGCSNFPGSSGTVEFWIQPGWQGDDGQVRLILDAGSKARDKISINKLANGRLGIGMFGTPAGTTNFVYSRADHDVRDWAAGSWHHVAACWGNGELALWLDGTNVARRSGALPPQSTPDSIRICGSDCAVDELCLSRIVRYSENGRAAGRAVPPRTQTGPGWRFNEPAGAYRCSPPENATAEYGLIVLPKNYLDDADPSNLPPLIKAGIQIVACPGEIEPAAFLLVATEPLKQVAITLTSLKSHNAAIAPDRFMIRRVVRTPMRKIYTAKNTETDLVGRFLPRWETCDMPANEFREIWLECRVPGDAPPGRYGGFVQITHSGGLLRHPIQLEVLPIALIDHPTKALASYYRLAPIMRDRPRVLRELRDMRDHGIRHLFPHIAIQYEREGTNIQPDFTEIREGLELLRAGGFGGATIIVETGFPTLARLLGHTDLGKGDGASLDEDPTFREIACRAICGLAQLQEAARDFRIVASHLDEVFGNRRLLDQYIRLSKAARQNPKAELYITFHTVKDENDAWRKDLDPFVDLRCNHGYSFELWLNRGHTMDEYQRELDASGDDAWFYHNARGSYWTPEWSRIINGIYLWAGPFNAHCPWTYQAYFQNPFDDTDGPIQKGHDWGLSFPGADDPGDLVPTTHYEAMREGADDLRYIATLEAAIEAARRQEIAEWPDARRFLDNLRSLIRNARPAADSLAVASKQGDVLDADTGLIMGQGAIGTPGESPLIFALATRFDADHWQSVRRDIVAWIIKLQEGRKP